MRANEITPIFQIKQVGAAPVRLARIPDQIEELLFLIGCVHDGQDCRIT